MDSTSASPASGPDHQSLAELRPIFELEHHVVRVLGEMGFGPASASATCDQPEDFAAFTVLQFLIVPEKCTWLDFMLEADRDTARHIFNTLTGTPAETDADCEDVLRETMNIIHGALKNAFRDDGVDLIIPLVPQSIAPARINTAQGGYSMQSRFTFSAANLTLRLTMVARVAPITRKELRKFRVAEVVVDPVTDSQEPEAGNVVQGHTMLNKRLLAKIRRLADQEPAGRQHAVIEPSPWAELLPND